MASRKMAYLLYGEPLTVSVRVKVTREQKAALMRAAELNLTSVAGVIREAVDAYVMDFQDDKLFGGPNPEPTQTIEQ